ncbi:MAG: hypothetical protein CV087_16955 [Candidatus Brocadia sp. WS118]|nr:MAG: hypothetical protein CV087_16955 [Candidatus Brocadia sp. WS118]
MIKAAIRSTLGYLKNIPGFTTNRRIVVLESDDWGSVRMPSKSAFAILKKKGYDIDSDAYCLYDTLATEKDLTRLFELLLKYKDANGNHPIITANAVVANPNFAQIRADEFERYSYELFTETLKSYPNCERSFELWQKGRAEGLFHPQFHGREHLNVRLWMKALKMGLKPALDTFELNMFAVNSDETLGNRDNYMAAFDFYDKLHEQEVLAIVEEGMRLFKNIHGYASKTFIAPCYTWSNSVEKKMAELGVESVQGIVKRKVPKGNKSSRYRTVYNYMGKKNKYGQHYLMRNAFMEASHNKNWGADYCLKSVEQAFKLNKPAIISSHRVNFLGSLEERNQVYNFKEFEKIFSTILKKWPSTEFMSSDELGRIMGSK